MKVKYSNLIAGLFFILVMLCICAIWHDPVYAASSVNKESIVSNIKNPSTGVIKYKVTVPPGEKIDYSVELTPDKKAGSVDKITGSWKNKAKRTVKKTITVNVKFLTDKYKIKASYSKEVSGKEIVYKDVDTAMSSLKKSTVTSKLSWDFDKLGKGNKNWKYRYKYVPYKNGFKKYLQVFDKNGRQIKNNVKQIVSIDKITKLIKEMKAR